MKQTGQGRWLAKCPAHEDRSPSLSIRELDDGAILLHDFGGCETGVVLAALGLAMSDLFPQRPAARNEANGAAPSNSRIPARDILEAIDSEVTVVATLAAGLAGGRALTAAEFSRLLTAVKRIQAARDMLHVR